MIWAGRRGGNGVFIRCEENLFDLFGEVRIEEGKGSKWANRFSLLSILMGNWEEGQSAKTK
jgi:hypothetical protein